MITPAQQDRDTTNQIVAAGTRIHSLDETGAKAYRFGYLAGLEHDRESLTILRSPEMVRISLLGYAIGEILADVLGPVRPS